MRRPGNDWNRIGSYGWDCHVQLCLSANPDGCPGGWDIFDCQWNKKTQLSVAEAYARVLQQPGSPELAPRLFAAAPSGISCSVATAARLAEV